jgi:hypothetical protein
VRLFSFCWVSVVIGVADFHRISLVIQSAFQCGTWLGFLYGTALKASRGSSVNIVSNYEMDNRGSISDKD